MSISITISCSWLQVEAEEGDDTADVDDVMDDVETLNYDDLDSVAKLQKSQRFHDLTKVGILEGLPLNLTLYLSHSFFFIFS